MHKRRLAHVSRFDYINIAEERRSRSNSKGPSFGRCLRTHEKSGGGWEQSDGHVALEACVHMCCGWAGQQISAREKEKPMNLPCVRHPSASREGERGLWITSEKEREREIFEKDNVHPSDI